MTTDNANLIRRAIIIGALGYFIDVFDIQLFAVLRTASLTDLGVPADRLARVAGIILNVQTLGLLAGGLLWGWLGDRLGRLKAMYGSILIYSVSTLLCSVVHDPVVYGVYRFLAGFGLAGETGAAVTLVAELMPAASRGWGVMLIGGIGFAGPIGAVGLGWLLPWRRAYVAAGVAGLIVFTLRKTLSESATFTQTRDSGVKRGSWSLLAKKGPLLKLLFCFLIGGPLLYGFNVINFFSTEWSRIVLRPDEVFVQKYALLAFYCGSVLGDFASGALTQLWRSRRKTITVFLVWGMVTSSAFLFGAPLVRLSSAQFYGAYFLMGLSVGYWVLMTTVAAEQFGTNIRATTSIVVTNLVRGFTIPIVFAFQALQPALGIDHSALAIGILIYPVSLFALWRLKETHGIDLHYVEDA